MATQPPKEPVLRASHAVGLPLLALLTVTACDRLGEIVLVPEHELIDSFESGIASWTVRTADLGASPGAWAVESTEETATDGVKALSIHLDNTGGAGKVWIVRQVELSPDMEYDVVVAFDLGTSDTAGTPPWTLIAGAYSSEPPSASGLSFRGGTTPDSLGAGAVTWVEKRYEVPLRSAVDGKGVVVLGLWGTTAESRTYYLDNVRVFFTRR